MNASNDWAKVAAITLSLALPAAALAGGFEPANDSGAEVTEYVITDEAAAPARPAKVIPVEYGSVLVPSDGAAIPSRGPVLESVPDKAVSCEMCGAQGCVSCCESGGCAAGGHGSGGFSARGYFNRVLGDACPRWVAQVDALMLWQGNIASRVLFVDQATGVPALDANQAQAPMSAGPRFGLLLNLDPVYAIEGNYFNVRSFSGQAITPVGTYQENNLAGYAYADITQAGVATSSGIQSAELNWRRRTCGPITWLAGFRWVEWNQQLTVLEAYDGGAAAFGSATGNDLYGGQLGMDMWLWNTKTSPIKVNGIGKAGIFYNQARQHTEYAENDVTIQSASAVADQTSFFGEVGANASVKITNWLAWRVGYSVFWLSAVATAPQQLSTTDFQIDPPTATINTNGSVLLHGVTTGLEARW